MRLSSELKLYTIAIEEPISYVAKSRIRLFCGSSARGHAASRSSAPCLRPSAPSRDPTACPVSLASAGHIPARRIPFPTRLPCHTTRTRSRDHTCAQPVSPTHSVDMCSPAPLTPLPTRLHPTQPCTFPALQVRPWARLGRARARRRRSSGSRAGAPCCGSASTAAAAARSSSIGGRKSDVAEESEATLSRRQVRDTKYFPLQYTVYYIAS